MTVPAAAVDAAMAAAPYRHGGRRHWQPAISRADMIRILQAAEPVLCVDERDRVRQWLGDSVERVQLLRHA